MKPTIEHLITPAESSFRYKRFSQNSFKFVWHCHRDYELTLILKGNGRRFVGDDVSDFAPGDLLFTGPGLPHTWYSEDNGETIVIQFGEYFLGKDFFALPEMRRLQLFFQKSAHGLVFERAIVNKVKSKMCQLEKVQSAKRIILLLDILDILANSTQYKSLSIHRFSMPIAGKSEKRIDTVCNYVYNHYIEPITLESISSIAGLKTQSFCRFFKNSTGKVFNDYLTELRIAHACMLLIETEKNISEVCFESGYSNLSNFNRRFAKLKGTSPRNYRNEFKDKEKR
jgi:AraC-like DNA-binding protein/mannose-6-phosphate isomerase-like protein (cupin superfamily)